MAKFGIHRVCGDASFAGWRDGAGVRGARAAFTLAEILIVIAIIILITTITLNGMVNSQKLFIFSNAYEHVLAMVRQARSLALTGKAQPDYTDYDGDGCYEKNHPNPPPPPADGCPADGDLVTPAHYGVYFDTASDPKKVVLFWDVHRSATVPLAENPEGGFVAGTATTSPPDKDVVLEEFALPQGLQLVATGGDGSKGAALFYSPVFADASFDPALDKQQNQIFFKFGVKEKMTSGRVRCSQIHPLAGIPEQAEDCTL